MVSMIPTVETIESRLVASNPELTPREVLRRAAAEERSLTLAERRARVARALPVLRNDAKILRGTLGATRTRYAALHLAEILDDLIVVLMDLNFIEPNRP